MNNSNGIRHTLNKTKVEQDLGINISRNLKWADHIQKVTNTKSYSSLGSLKRTFKTWTPESFIKLYTDYIRPQVEYCASVWNPHLKKDINYLAQVQHIATKLVPQIRILPYLKRLCILGLQTIEERRLRGDLIQY